MGYIYKITNTINNKCYIGQTTRNVQERYCEHLDELVFNRKRNTHFQNAFNKYGKENFALEILEEVDDSFLNQREMFYINFFDSYKNGYNATVGGEGIRGFSFTNLQKEKLSQIIKERWFDDNYRMKVIESRKKYYKNNPDSKIKKSLFFKEKWQDEEFKKTMASRVGTLGQKMSENTKCKIGDKAKSRYLNNKSNVKTILEEHNKDTMIQIKCVETNQIFASIKEAARILNIDSSLLGRVVSNKEKYKKYKSANGYHFIKVVEYGR